MEFNRNQYFLFGMVLLLVGFQLKSLEAIVLNEEATQFLAQRMKSTEVASANQLPTLFAASAPVVKKRLEIPNWLGWSLISVGSVLVLHSLALKKPG